MNRNPLVVLPTEQPRARVVIVTCFGVVASLSGCRTDAVHKSMPSSPATAPPSAPAASITASSKPLDCEWLRSTNNCWQTMKREIRECLGPLPIKGTLDHDGRICTSSNAEVLFRPAVPQGEPWALDIEARVANKTCFRYRDTGLGGAHRKHVFEGPSGAQISFTSDLPVTLTCPDGSSFQTADPDPALERCERERVWEGALPLAVGALSNPVWQVIDPRWGHVFDCERPSEPQSVEVVPASYPLRSSRRSRA